MNVFALLTLVFSGALIATQATLNGQLGRSLGLALFVFVFSLMQTAFSLPLLLNAKFDWQVFVAIPWWQHIGSFLGVFILLGISFSLPKVGTFAAMAALLVGQMSMGLVIDQFGLFGNAVQPITAVKLLGLAFLGVGVFLVKQ